MNNNNKLEQQPVENTNTGEKPKVSLYSVYVLLILMIVYVFNFVDRQILSILAPYIKQDLGISDAQMGFLYGTAFAVFYAIFGIPLGKLADVWVRKKIIAFGLGLWSVMTALSGTARSFLSLSVYRFGVGVGEASASPAAYSMLIDSFPKALRATALSVYSSGVFIGSGLALFIGGGVVGRWDKAYAAKDLAAPFDLVGWQVAFLVVGIPGLILALWVYTLREPVRGAMDGLVTENHPEPFKVFFQELATILPPLSLWHLAKKPNAKKEILFNLAMLVSISLICIGLIKYLGKAHIPQWGAVGLGVYASASWAQNLRLRDSASFELIFKTKSVVLGLFGFSFIAFVTYGTGFWFNSYFIQALNPDPAEYGLKAGIAVAVGGFIGVNLGGVISDALKSKTPKARLIVGLLTAALSFPMVLWMLKIQDLDLAYKAIFLFFIVSTLYVGSAPTLANEMVLPRMRAVASAVYLLILTLIGLALGPYTIGVMSDKLRATYAENALGQSIYLSAWVLILACVLLLLGMLYINKEEKTILERANKAQELA